MDLKLSKRGRVAPSGESPTVMDPIDPYSADVSGRDLRAIEGDTRVSHSRWGVHETRLQCAAVDRAMDRDAQNQLGAAIRDGIRSVVTGGKHMELGPIERSAANGNVDRTKGPISAILAGKDPATSHTDAVGSGGGKGWRGKH